MLTYLPMTGYTKLFSSIVASTIWREAKHTKVVWITLLALANKNGIVEASLPGLADLARVSVEECTEAIRILSSPDEFSRSKSYQGRRVRIIPGAFVILNHSRYRNKMTLDERREYLRIKQQERRAKLKKPSTRRKQTYTNVNNGQQTSTVSTQAEAEAEAEAKISLNGVRAREEIASVAELTRGLASKLFHRQEGQRPTYAEESLATAILARNSWRSERDEILNFHAKLTGDAKRFAGFPKCLCDLLQSWTETLDKARTFDPKAYEPKATIQPRAQHFDRNKGTANEGTAHLYQVKKPVKAAV